MPHPANCTLQLNPNQTGITIDALIKPISEDAPNKHNPQHHPICQFFVCDFGDRLALPVLHAVLEIVNRRPQYKSQLYSVHNPPDNINRLIFEAQNEEIIYKVLKLIHERNVFRNKIHRIPPNENDELIKNPLKCLPFKIGQIVLLRNPQFQDQYAQIVAIEYKTAKIWVKTYPHIDYQELEIMKLNSQKQLNQIKDISYKAPECPFDETKLQTEEAFLPFSLPNGNHPRCIKWDGNYFVETCQYVQLDYKDIQSIRIDAIPEDIIDRFEVCLSSFENDNKSFLNGMRGIQTSVHQSDFVFKLSLDLGKPSQPLKKSKHQYDINQPSKESEHQNTTKDDDFDLSNRQFPPSLPLTSSSTFNVLTQKPTLPSIQKSKNLIHQTQFALPSKNHIFSQPFPQNSLNPSVETTNLPISQDSNPSTSFGEREGDDPHSDEFEFEQNLSPNCQKVSFLSDDPHSDEFELMTQNSIDLEQKSSISNSLNPRVEATPMSDQSNSNSSKSSNLNYLSDDDHSDVFDYYEQ